MRTYVHAVVVLVSFHFLSMSSHALVRGVPLHNKLQGVHVVQNDAKSTCTAVLVGHRPLTALTAIHCLTNLRDGGLTLQISKAQYRSTRVWIDARLLENKDFQAVVTGLTQATRAHDDLAVMKARLNYGVFSKNAGYTLFAIVQFDGHDENLAVLPLSQTGLTEAQRVLLTGNANSDGSFEGTLNVIAGFSKQLHQFSCFGATESDAPSIAAPRGTWGVPSSQDSGAPVLSSDGVVGITESIATVRLKKPLLPKHPADVEGAYAAVMADFTYLFEPAARELLKEASENGAHIVFNDEKLKKNFNFFEMLELPKPQKK